MKMDYSYYHDTRFAELDCPIDDVVATMHVDDDDRNVMVLDFDKVESDREIDAYTLSKFLEEYYYDLEVVEIKSDNPVHLVGDASSMFTYLHRVDGCENLDVSGVTNMYGMFIGCNDDDFNPNIGEWDVSNVNEMSNMFSSCSGEHFNPDIGSWDVSSVGRMASMFADCCGSDFNPDLSEWNVSRLFDVNEMFRNCSGEAFNPDISSWDTSWFRNMSRMFSGCNGESFEAPDLSKVNFGRFMEFSEVEDVLKKI